MKKLAFLAFVAIIAFSSCGSDELDEPDSQDTPIVGGTSVDHTYVDLGVTVDGKTIYWATTNVGADNAYDYGNYYAWGETRAYGEEMDSYPYYWNNNLTNQAYISGVVKTDYSWSTYKWGDSSSYFFKYYSKDEKLDEDDDAATVNWGSGWHMPTVDEFYALTSQCYWKWVTEYNGHTVKGYMVFKLKSKMDKGMKTNNLNPYTPYAEYTESDTHIFLPVGGRRNNSSLDDADYGCYWLSTNDLSDVVYAKCFLINPSSGFGINSQERRFGFAVRPAYEGFDD